ncbi:Ig-like domain-containing protein [Lactiplantibacillus daowaiensis]|uniref:Ig-like domain-containing protein n=1 Tax=Lactiplantibacillus daowaiensis TaxID=2559918 RepID=A0ABW1S2I1_9LACO|nr:collagen binding domain-containing protein [Lactiplantibacillus daowaiensis]
MKRKQQVWRWLLGFVSLIGLLIMTQLVTPVKAAAANFDASNYITSAQVTNGPDFKPADTVDIQYKLDFGSQELKSGDTVTIPLPSNLKAKTVGDTFDVVDTDGTVVGTAEVFDGEVVITMNSALEGKTNDKMTLNLATKYRGDDYGEKDVVFNDKNTSQINIVDNDANLSKKGTIQDNGTIKWTILVDRRELEMKNLKISDTIGDNQAMIKDITVYNGEWTSNSSYKRKNEISSSDYSVTYNDKGFDLAFNNTVSNLVVIDYYTEVTDKTLIDSGYKFRNKAIMTWGGGTSGGPNSEEANGKVSSSNGNSGSGSGDENETTEEPDDGDTGTTDTDDGYDPEYPDVDENTDSSSSSSSSSSSESSTSSSSSSSSSSTSSTDDKNQAVEPSTSSSSSIANSSSADSTSAKNDSNKAVKPATKTTSAKATKAAKPVATSTDAARAVAHNRQLPQTNESKVSHQTLSLLGSVLAVFTLGAGALVRHWF